MTPPAHPTRRTFDGEVKTARVLTFKINDQDVSAREDETILSVARQNGIYIPTLCHLDGLSERGTCRLCLVEIKGSPKLVPACVTLARM